MIEHLPFEILPQPTETTCGPTCLQAVYRYFGDDVGLGEVINQVPVLAQGGTLGVYLACHALRRGYRATIYTYNLQMFDPTWFVPYPVDLRPKLVQQRVEKDDPRLLAATDGYLQFLDLGGRVRFQDLTPGLIRRYLKRGVPILTGLSATYLHRSPREFGPRDDEDDVRGEPQGHFVVLCGYDPDERSVTVADPLQPNPLATSHTYALSIDRVVGAILLGVLTYDANLLIIEPPSGRKRTGLAAADRR